jgi:hypothetical protein
MALVLLVGYAPGATSVGAMEEWCDVDPVLVVTTPAGHLISLFYVTGAQGLQHSLTTQLATVQYTAVPANGGQATLVTLNVTVPNDAFGSGFPTRLTASSGPWGTLDVYGSTSGSSGRAMRVQFTLNVP